MEYCSENVNLNAPNPITSKLTDKYRSAPHPRVQLSIIVYIYRFHVSFSFITATNIRFQ